MKKLITRKLCALILSAFLGFHLFAGNSQTEKTKEKFKVELTPLGDCIYKIPEVLNNENWVIFLNIVNNSSETMNLESIEFDIFSKSKLITSETNYYNKSISSDSNHKLNSIFFRKNRSLNCDKMKVKLTTSLGKKTLKINLKRYKQPIEIYFPLKGVWQVVSAQEFGITHRRWDNFAQFAYDFSLFDRTGNLYKGNPNNLNDYYAFGRSVFAPTDCTVYKVQDGIEDNTVIGKSAIHANYVRLDLGSNILCTLVHFKKGSIVVREGQKLKRGDKIAEVGNSGASNYPHLHMQIQKYNVNSDKPLKPGIPLPLSLSNIELHPLYYHTWIFHKSAYLKTGDYIKSTQSK
ncbi:MAG: M23 family metallopeptidase, partial [bacterium]|nr:M23 family metallopeptidase [bacterium]